MRVQRTGKRLRPGISHKYFANNIEEWLKLKDSKIIDLPEKEAKSILELFDNSIEIVKETKVEKRPKLENEIGGVENDD